MESMTPDIDGAYRKIRPVAPSPSAMSYSQVLPTPCRATSRNTQYEVDRKIRDDVKLSDAIVTTRYDLQCTM